MVKTLSAFVILIVAVAVGGFVNYQRNAPMDAELANRPYADLATKDLVSLQSAYQAEVAGFQKKLGDPSADRTTALDGLAPGDVGGRALAFDSFQRKNQAWRALNLQKIERQLELDKISRELSIRSKGLDDPKKRIMRRILTF